MRLTYLIRIAALILLRSWRATVVLAFMVVTAVAALVFLSALAIGTNDAMIRNSTGLFSGHIAITGLNDRDANRLQIPGVSYLLLRRHQQVLLSAKDRFEPAVLMGIEPEKEQAARHKYNQDALDGEINLDRRGQWMGFSIAIIILVMAAVFAWKGNTTFAGTLVAIDLIGLVSVFVLGRRQGKKDE